LYENKRKDLNTSPERRETVGKVEWRWVKERKEYVVEKDGKVLATVIFEEKYNEEERTQTVTVFPMSSEYGGYVGNVVEVKIDPRFGRLVASEYLRLIAEIIEKMTR
jgi:CO/xanthine dehydrogenase Mo-binding subunit